MAKKTSKQASSRRLKKYEQIALDLEKKIQQGVYSKKLPGIRLLAEDLNTNAMTLGTAIKLLVEKGLLYRIPKSGTYIQDGGQKRTGSIAFVVNDMKLPLTSRILSAMSEVAQEKKLRLVLFNFLQNTNRETAIIKEIIRDHSVDGIVWFPSSLDALIRLRDTFKVGKMPFIGTGIPYAGVEETVVTADPFDGFRTLTRHLVDTGCKSILYLTDRSRSKVSEISPKYLGYRTVMDDVKLEVARPQILDMKRLEEDSTYQSGLLQQFRKCDALLCAHDRMAARVYHFLLANRVRCPEDIALASYDGLEISETLGITTYAQPVEEIGRTVLTNMLKLISDPNAEVGNELIPGKLIVRKSSLRKVS
jgi:LacI family transcriptional regulator